MKLEKFMNSWFYKICEKIYQLIILNMLSIIMIILGLGVFSLMPAIISIIMVLKSSTKDNKVPLFKAYFVSFFKYYLKAQLLFLFFLALILLFGFNTYYFYAWTNEVANVYYTIAYYLTVIIDIILLLAFINSCFVFVYFPHLSYFKKIKYSFVLLIAETWKALILFVILLLEVIIAFVIPYLIPIILLSFFCFISYLFLDKDYTKIIPIEYKSLDIIDDLAILRSKKVNKQ